MPHPILRLKPKEGRRARAGCPWIFSNEIAMDEKARALPPGALVTAILDDGNVLGTGFFNPKSLIAVRMLTPGENVPIDAEFLGGRLKRALSLREKLYDAPYYRLVNAEGDGLPGLIIDRFGEALAIQIGAAGMEALKEPLFAALEKLLKPGDIILKNDAPARALEGLELYAANEKGNAGRLVLEENGIRYFAEPITGQKTGWYYDQRENRAAIMALSKGASVLDAYCHSGGFALAAAKGGAPDVTGIDSSAPAIALAEEAAKTNGLRARFVKADVLEELERLANENQTFDIVIADPPPFVKARKDLEAGARAYRKLATMAARVTAPGGFLFLASCSHNIPAERFALECANGIARAAKPAKLLRQSGASADHPAHLFLPESAYLKALLYRID